MTERSIRPIISLFVAVSMTSSCTTGVLSCGPPIASDTANWPEDIRPYEHIVVVVEENKDPEEIYDAHRAPFINHLAKQGAYFTQMFGEEHFSQGNYFWLFSGDNRGVGHLDRPPDTPINASNLGRALKKAGHSFKGYVESLPEAVMTDEAPPGCTLDNCIYGRKHVPWLGFTDFTIGSGMEMTQSFEKSWPDPADFDHLPTVAFVIPNLDDDMHNGLDAQSVPRGDAWLAEHLALYYEWAKVHNSLLIVTFDENNDTTSFIGLTDPHAFPGAESEGLRVRRNKIPMVFAGARVKHRDGGYDEGRGITHVNVLRTIEAMYGLQRSGGQQGCAAAQGIPDRFISDVFERN